MEQQTYANHARFSAPYHFVAAPLALVVVVMAIMNLVHVAGTPDWMYTGLMPLLMAIVLLITFSLSRVFSNKVQDRAIRAEESLRAYILTGKPVDNRLDIRQLIALRFAPDEEYAALSQRAASEQLKPADIKKAIKNWRADHHRC